MMNNFAYRHAFGLGLACLFVVAVGCGSGSGPALDPSTQATISGTVTIDGTPIPVDSVVHFESADTGTTATGKIDALGNFSAVVPDPKKGLVAGRYRVMVAPPPKPAVEMSNMDAYSNAMKSGGAAAKPGSGNSSSPIPKQFQSLQTTKLILEVKPGPNTFNIDLAKIQ